MRIQTKTITPTVSNILQILRISISFKGFLNFCGIGERAMIAALTLSMIS